MSCLSNTEELPADRRSSDRLGAGHGHVLIKRTLLFRFKRDFYLNDTLGEEQTMATHTFYLHSFVKLCLGVLSVNPWKTPKELELPRLLLDVVAESI